MTPNKTPELADLEERLGHHFRDPALLRRALVTPSYRADHETQEPGDNQRLEFLGDAVIGLLTACHVYGAHADEGEGRLTVRRSLLASRQALADLARRARLGPHLLLGKVEERSGGRDKERLLADAMEAVFGALWCDGGLAAAQTAYTRIAAQDSPQDLWASNPKGRLQETAQRHGWPDSPAYALDATTGPDHAPQFTVTASVHGGHQATATAATKRLAETAAARALLAILADAGLA